MLWQRFELHSAQGSWQPVWGGCSEEKRGELEEPAGKGRGL